MARYAEHARQQLRGNSIWERIRDSFTLGIAYTKLPRGAAVEDSDVVVVRKRSSDVRLLVSWRWMFVPDARGRGNETSIGFFEAVPFGRNDPMSATVSILITDVMYTLKELLVSCNSWSGSSFGLASELR